MSGSCSTIEGEQKCLQTLVTDPKGKIPYWRHNLRKEDNIAMYFKELCLTGCLLDLSVRY